MPNHQMSPLEADVQASIASTEEERRAWRHKAAIERFWRGRGVPVDVRVIETEVDIGNGFKATLFTLESDLKLGVPA